MEQVKNFIDLVAQGNNIEAKSSLDELLSARAFEALEDKKQEIGGTLFNGVTSQVDQPEVQDAE
jgi:hypothetical protein